MNANALQRAVDEIAFEYDPLKHDGKKGRWTLNGLDVDADLRVIIIVPTAKHSGILFDDEGRKVGQTPVTRYTAAPPPREYATADWKPSTTVTGVIDDDTKRLVTLSTLTWTGRTAFARILSPYLARGMRQYPICQLASALKKNDSHGNFAPTITVVDWITCSAFPDLAPPVDAVPVIETPKPAVIERPRPTITSGRAPVAVHDDELPPAPPPIDAYDGPLDDDVEF